MNLAGLSIESLNGLAPAERLGWALLHSLWQEALLAAMLAAMLACLRGRSAAARYATACCAMIAMAAVPVALAIFALNAGPVANVPARHASATGVLLRPSAIRNDAAAVAASLPDALPRDPWPVLLRSASFSWAIGATVLCLWHLLGWARVRRMSRGAAAAPTFWERRLAELADRLHLAARVRLRVCDRIGAPAVVSWFRPVVLVPASAISGLPPHQLEALLLHELAHVRRHDYLANLLQTAVETMLFYHPAVWWVSATIRREREHCCDDLAARYCGGGALAYARSLAAMEALRATWVPAPALGSDGGRLLARIRRLLGPGAAVRPVGRRPVALGGVLVVAACAAAWLATARPIAHAADPGPSAAVPATRSADGEAEGIRPEDLRANRGDYRIVPNDLVSVTISDLNGPNSETVKQCRVSESGAISMPYLDRPIHAAGLTDIQLEQAIVGAYRDAHLIEHAQVSAAITEARGRSFNVLGHVARPGEFAIQQNDFCLLDALAVAGGTHGPVDTIRILRRQPAEKQADAATAASKPRVINIPADRLLGGSAKLDPKLNVLIRPGDTLMFLGPDAPASRPGAERSVRLVVGNDALHFQGKAVSWEQLPALVEQIPDRADTVLEIGAESRDVTVGHYFDAQVRAGELVRKYGLKYLSQVGTSADERGDSAGNPARHQ